MTASKFQLHFPAWCSNVAFSCLCAYAFVHKAYLCVSNMPLAVGEITSLDLITFNEGNCQNGQKQLQGFIVCSIFLISYLT